MIIIIILIIVLLYFIYKHIIVKQNFHFTYKNENENENENISFNYNTPNISFNYNTPNIVFDYEQIHTEFDYTHPTNMSDHINENKYSRKKFITNLKSWYNNIWIDSIDENGNPQYNSANNDIYNSTILVNDDIDNIDIIELENINKGNTISNIYDSLIQDYKHI